MEPLQREVKDADIGPRKANEEIVPTNREHPVPNVPGK